MTWTGDISRMGALADRLGDLARVPSRVAARVADDLEAEVQAEFDAGADPYGTPWAPLAPYTLAKPRHPPPLTDTGAMRDSLRIAPMAGAGVEITIDHPAAPHQTGWSGRQGWGPARPILPDRGALPPAWQAIIADACEDEFREAVGT
jgi:phage gpG-like protein